jgi:hypothetical protein
MPSRPPSPSTTTWSVRSSSGRGSSRPPRMARTRPARSPTKRVVSSSATANATGSRNRASRSSRTTTPSSSAWVGGPARTGVAVAARVVPVLKEAVAGPGWDDVSWSASCPQAPAASTSAGARVTIRHGRRAAIVLSLGAPVIRADAS